MSSTRIISYESRGNSLMAMANHDLETMSVMNLTRVSEDFLQADGFQSPERVFSPVKARAPRPLPRLSPLPANIRQFLYNEPAIQLRPKRTRKEIKLCSQSFDFTSVPQKPEKHPSELPFFQDLKARYEKAKKAMLGSIPPPVAAKGVVELTRKKELAGKTVVLKKKAAKPRTLPPLVVAPFQQKARMRRSDTFV